MLMEASWSGVLWRMGQCMPLPLGLLVRVFCTDTGRLLAYSALPRTVVLAECPSAVQERRVQGKEVWELFQSSIASLAFENLFKNMVLIKVRCVFTAHC